MAKFSVYQIILSDAVIAKVNGGACPLEYMAYLDVTVKADITLAVEQRFFQKVAVIEASDLEDVFKIGNLGPEESIQRLGRMHSVSVGDVVGDEAGKFHMVDRFGFKEVEFQGEQ